MNGENNKNVSVDVKKEFPAKVDHRHRGVDYKKDSLMKLDSREQQKLSKKKII